MSKKERAERGALGEQQCIKLKFSCLLVESTKKNKLQCETRNEPHSEWLAFTLTLLLGALSREVSQTFHFSLRADLNIFSSESDYPFFHSTATANSIRADANGASSSYYVTKYFLHQYDEKQQKKCSPSSLLPLRLAKQQRRSFQRKHVVNALKRNFFTTSTIFLLALQFSLAHSSLSRNWIKFKWQINMTQYDFYWFLSVIAREDKKTWSKLLAGMGWLDRAFSAWTSKIRRRSHRNVLIIQDETLVNITPQSVVIVSLWETPPHALTSMYRE